MSSDKIEAYYSREHPFQKGLQQLREIILKTELEEQLKWGAPVYSLNNKNVLGVMGFKNHFGIWFFNGVFLSDPLGVLQNAQQEKTRAMRQWRFSRNEGIDTTAVLSYVEEAIANQKKGLKLSPERKKEVEIPMLLQTALKDPRLKKAFESLTQGRQREYCEYINSARQEKTKHSRIEKIFPMILQGKGLNDHYR
ncbi:YdeI/OmpD-associated family protein [Lentiprolixibacter aurantiacus]|uniref:YdeI/OmpD-associated family protein n=1 Tax=Lentiprolixibacter aurantiacus TaxID=2993939 RepID=A0AAE3MPA7_9FLAO|nr:YdeI/OmpD-associated family protein [Lentiprolixibacter aurantiacus]MCX2720502.1 YdeI/OmpD-associated family protein [Lentiprolixibacter aurantiacus]